MTEHDPEQEAVRRLLGEVPPPGPVPDDVVARLDARLAELVAERPAANSGDELAAARRRRRFRTVLVAAASVSVLGLGLGTVLDDMSGDQGGSADSATAGAQSDTMARELQEDAAEPSAPGELREGGGAGGGVSPRVEGDSSGQAGEAFRPVVRRASLEADVDRIVARRVFRDGAGSGDGVARLVAPCDLPPLESGDRAVPIRFEGADATLVVRTPEGGTREVEIYACDSRGAALATSSVPAR